MNEYRDVRVVLDSVDKVRTFVSLNVQSDCSVNVGREAKIIDGSSLVGIMTLDLGRKIPVRIHGDRDRIDDLIRSYSDNGLKLV